MKKIYLVRHAKSSWRHEGVMDLDRPLKGRGIRDAYNTSAWLGQQGENPEVMISSPATRALHTALIFSKNLGFPFSEIRIDEALYHASVKDLLRIARAQDDRYSSIMIFGHNPTITEFVNRCIDHRIDNVPTTGVACLKFDDSSWAGIDRRAELLFFDYPKRRKSK